MHRTTISVAGGRRDSFEDDYDDRMSFDFAMPSFFTGTFTSVYDIYADTTLPPPPNGGRVAMQFLRLSVALRHRIRPRYVCFAIEMKQARAHTRETRHKGRKQGKLHVDTRDTSVERSPVAGL